MFKVSKHKNQIESIDLPKGISVKLAPNSTEIEMPNQTINSAAYLGEMKNTKFDQVLKALMSQRQITLKGLARATSIPLSTLGSYTAGKKASYSSDHIARLCDYFGVSADYLLFGQDTSVGALNSLPVEEIFQGWVKIKVERAVPIKGRKKE